MARNTYSVTAVLLKELSWRLKQKQENISQVRPGSRLPDRSRGVRAHTQTWHCKASLRARPARSLYLGLLSAHARNDTPSRGPAARQTTKPGSPRGCGDRAGRGGARGEAGTRGSPQGAPGALPRDSNLASPAPRLIPASRCQPPPGLAIGKPNSFCLGAEIPGGLAFFQTSPTNFTKLPPLGMETSKDSSVVHKKTRERVRRGRGPNCRFHFIFLFVCCFRLPRKKKRLWRRARCITPDLSALLFQSLRGSARPRTTEPWMSPRRASGGFIAGISWWLRGTVQEVGLPKPKLCSGAPLWRMRDQIHKRSLSPLNKGSSVGGREGCQPPLASPWGYLSCPLSIVHFSCQFDLATEWKSSERCLFWILS